MERNNINMGVNVFTLKFRYRLGNPQTVSHTMHAASRVVMLIPLTCVLGGNKGKALAVVRHLHRAGWRVVLLEVHT